MRTLKILYFLAIALFLGAIPQTAMGQSTPLTDTINKIVAQEQAEMQLLKQYSPLVETYVQNLRLDKDLGPVPDGDKYFLGRAELSKGVDLLPLVQSTTAKRKALSPVENFFSMEFLPRGFLQMIYLDMNGFDREHYKFDYMGRQFLGEVRCLIFDVAPVVGNEKGRFVGRIWVEDQDYHIVRFNGTYTGSGKISYYFSFDSWRHNVTKDQWLPSFIYSAEGKPQDIPAKAMGFQAFRAQTRLWGYSVGRVQEEQELGKILVETPVKETEIATDYSPLQAELIWSRQAEDNVTVRLEHMGVLAPHGDVDKVLETVVNNLEITNNLEFQPEVRCRILMTSTFESFTMGHTIILSRGLVDVLPDEATLAAILAHELGHIVLGHRMDTQFAFFDRLQFDEKRTFHHFDFVHTKDEEQAANQKGMELLNNSPYKDKLSVAALFLEELRNRSKYIPNLISPHLGDRVLSNWTVDTAQTSTDKPAENVIAALPLGGRVKVEPWNDQLQIFKFNQTSAVPEHEKMSFEITPFVIYLTRLTTNSASAENPTSTISAKSTELQ